MSYIQVILCTEISISYDKKSFFHYDDAILGHELCE